MGRRLLLCLLAAGLAVRLWLAFAYTGVDYDIESYEVVRGALANDPLHLYDIANGDPYNRWPYMTGFLPMIALAHGLEGVLGGPFHGWVQVPQILADLALALIVFAYLGRRGASERTRLAAAGLVALGPSFVVISGFHGQLDSFAILPAALALYLWDRLPPGGRRALACGALIGAGVAIKTVPGLMLFALLPTARRHRERALLVAAAAAVPLVALAPWLAADPAVTVEALRSHRALPGVGGISLLVQPELSRIWLGTDVVQLSGATDWLQERQTALVALCVLPFAALAYRRRMEPARAATLLWLAIYVFGIAFTFQYAVWGLPFALMAGYVRAVAIVQGALLVPALMVYAKPFGAGAEYVYVPWMVAIWAGLVVALARLTLRSRTPAPAPAAA